MILNYEGIDIPVSKRDYCRIEQKKIFASMYFVMKMIWFMLFMYQMKDLKIV